MKIKRLIAVSAAVVMAAVSVECVPAAAKTTVATPKNFTVKNGAKGFKFSWSKVKGATKYVVSYKIKGSKGKFQSAYKGKATSFTDAVYKLGKVYSFKVKAYKGSKSGKYSKVVNQMFLSRPQLNAEELIDFRGITLEWPEVKGAKTYKIYRSLKSEDSFTKIAEVDMTQVPYKDQDVKSIESYKYYVVACNGSYKSAKSKVKSEVYGANPLLETSTYNLTLKKGQVYKDIYKKVYDTLPYKLHAADYIKSWTSSDKSVVTVSKKGVYKAKKKGEAKVTVKAAYGGKNYKAVIEVVVK